MAETSAFLTQVRCLRKVLNGCNGFSFSLIVRVRLGRCCIELHYGNIFEDAIASIIGCFEVAQGNGSK